MPRKKVHRKPEAEYTHLAIRVDRYEVRASARVHYYVEHPENAFRYLEDGDPVFDYSTHLTIIGRSVYPEKRAGDRYELRVYGDEGPSSRVNLTLKDIRELDEHRVPKYRTYRGAEVPVFRSPQGFGLLDKSGDGWSAWIPVAPRLVSDMLVLLGSGAPLYAAVDEKREGRTRWVRSMGLQTTNPADE